MSETHIPPHPQLRRSAARRALGDGPWWCEASQWAEEAQRPCPEARCVSYQFGDTILDVNSSYDRLLEDLDQAYGDCAVAGDYIGSGARVGCTVRLVKERSLVALKFAALGLPHLMDIAMCWIRPRVELQHFSVREIASTGWRLLADDLDDEAPLLAANTHTVLIDLRLEPLEFLLNYVVGVAQLAQPPVIFVHGGGVSIDGCGTLLIGRSGQGKSTTSVALASRGHALLGDETVGIRPASGELLAFRRTLKLRPGPRPLALVKRLDVVPHVMRLDTQGVLCAWVRPSVLFPGYPPPPATPLGSIFFLREFREQASIEPFVPSLAHLEALQALTMSLSAVVSWPLSAAHRLMRFVRMIELFAKSPCYFLNLGTPDETAALIERTVRRQCH